MLMEKERLDLIKFGKRLVEADLTKGTGGNLSVYDPESKYMAITPSGIDFFDIKAEDIVIMELDGTVVEGDKKPSSEWYMHAIQYKNRKDISAIIHGHTTYSTVMAVLREDIPASHYMIALAGPNVRCADYASYGTKELGDNAYEAMKDRYAVLLANHGILAGSYSLANTFNIIEEVEYCAKIYYMARSIGKPVILDKEEMDLMIERFETYARVK